MRPHDMKYIGFKHQRENKQNNDKKYYLERGRNWGQLGK
jgi:hypothetical protein